MVKNLPAMQEIWVRSLGREDALEKRTAAHSSILAWRIPWTEEPWWAVVHGVGESWTRLQPTQQRFYLFIFCQDVRVCCPKNMNLFHMELRFS